MGGGSSFLMRIFATREEHKDAKFNKSHEVLENTTNLSKTKSCFPGTLCLREIRLDLKRPNFHFFLQIDNKESKKTKFEKHKCQQKQPTEVFCKKRCS